MVNFLRLHRPETGTDVTVPAPFPFEGMTEQIARELDRFVQETYPGFELCGFRETAT